ncbi:MAG: hypothetical protein WC558_15260 [Patulibacter sp.]
MPKTDPSIGLPAPFRLAGFEGSLGEWLDYLEWQYRAIIGEAGLKLWGKPIRAAGDGAQAADGRDRRFWHLITTGTAAHTERTRRLDLRRCAMFGQVWALLELAEAEDPRVMWWRWGDTVFLAPVDTSMVVVLRETKGEFLLTSFYPVRGQKQRNRYWRHAATSWRTGESQRVDRRHRLWRAYCRGTKPTAVHLLTVGYRT